MEAFWSWINSIKVSVLPKSKLSETINYSLNQKEDLQNYLEDGNCSISNNLAENSIRTFTIGRKNWLFSGSPKGAAAIAAVYSMIESAKANDLNPYKYLCYIFSELPCVQFGQHPEFLEKLSPMVSGGSGQIQIGQKLKFISVFAFFLSTMLFNAYC
mgnify:CR=1 FL=1